MRIFGGILPFFGWRVINVYSDGEPCDEGNSLWAANALEVEWLNRGAIIFIGRIYRKEEA